MFLFLFLVEFLHSHESFFDDKPILNGFDESSNHKNPNFRIIKSKFAEIPGISLNLNDINIEIKSSIFTKLKNQIKLSSDEIRTYSDRLIVTNTTNILKNTLFDFIITDLDGAIYAFYLQFIVKDSVFSNNQAKNGGAVAMNNCSTDFLATNFSRCYATQTSGALYASYSSINFEHCYFYGCEGESLGGVAVYKHCPISKKSSAFIKSKAHSVAVYFIDGSKFSDTNSLYIHNSCSNKLSALIQTVYNNASFTLCTFMNNSMGEEFSITDGFLFLDKTFLENKEIISAYNDTLMVTYVNIPSKEPIIDIILNRPSKRRAVFLDVSEADNLKPLFRSISILGAAALFSYILLPIAKKSSIYQKGETIQPKA